MIAFEDWVDHERAGQFGLHGRRLDVLALVARGFTYAQVAVELRLSSDTVKRHVGSLLREMSARSQAEAVALAYDHGVLRTAAVRAEIAQWRQRLASCGCGERGAA